MSEEIHDAQFREEPSTALAPVSEHGALAVSERLDREAIVAKHDDFEWLKARFLDRKKHIYVTNGKDRVNSAGWEHLAMCVGVSITQPNGPPTRELLQGVNGRPLVSYSAFVRATFRNRVAERSGRCDSTEAKHNQYEHKMEQVASTRAVNRAVAILLGGAESDIADDDNPPADAPSAPQRVPVAQLKALAQHAGVADFRAWLAHEIPTCADYARPDCQRPLTPEESLEAADKLRALQNGAITENQIARIHIIAKEAGLLDSEYRALLLRVTQKPSSTQLTRAQGDAVIAALLSVRDERRASA